MKRVLVLFVLVAAPFSMAHARGHALQKVSVEQLRQTLAALHGKSDKKIAKQLAGVELTERLSRAEFDALSKTLPGKQSRTTLLALEDASMFLDPPASEKLPDPAPNAQTQREILKKAVEFVDEQTDMVPGFLATRTTEHFQDVRVYPYSNKIEYYTPGSFRFLEQQVDDIRCTVGGDEAQEQPDRDLDRRMSKQPQPLMYMTIWGYQTIWGNITWNIPNVTQEGMEPSGAFGPWLQAITADMSDAQTEWGYWERTESGRLAVIRFRIPGGDSHFTIEYRFKPPSAIAPASEQGREYNADPGYHGEVAFDPATGRIARLVVICDFAKGAPMQKADMEIDYGAVQIGDASYDLPLRGVSVSSFLLATHDLLFDNGDSIGEQSDHFPVTSVDDLTFSNYRIYKPRIRIVPLKSLDSPSK